MRFNEQAKPTSSSRGGSGKRTRSRHVQHTLRSNLGDVIDLSTDGVRIRCRRVPSGRTEIILSDVIRAGQLYGTVAWSKSVGNFHHDVGFKFEKVSREMAERLQRIAEHHRFRRAI